jgi:WD40 repeat protein
MQKEQAILRGHADKINAIAVTADCQRMISASRDASVKVWDLNSGIELHTLRGHTRSVYRVIVTPDNRRAISVSGDGTFRVWDLEYGEELLTLHNDTDYVTALKMTPDGRRAASASVDSTLRVWDLERGVVIASFSADGPLEDCAIAPDGVHIVAGEQSGRMFFLRLEGLDS